jgi:putative redox protein
MTAPGGSRMRAVVRRQNSAVHFVAETGSGGRVPIDGSPAVGGQGLGARPMELLLSALGGCAGIDVVGILAKQRQVVDDLVVAVDGERTPGEPSLFARIHLHFAVTGPTDERAVRRAVELSMEKYCSVARVLEHTAEITYGCGLVPAVVSPEAASP